MHKHNKRSMRAKHTTKSRSTSKRHRSLRKKSGGGIFDSTPDNPADNSQSWHEKASDFLANLFSSAPPVPQNAPPPPRPGQPPAQAQAPITTAPQAPTTTAPHAPTTTAPPASGTTTATTTPEFGSDNNKFESDNNKFGSPSGTFGGRRRSNKNKNKNKNKKK